MNYLPLENAVLQAFILANKSVEEGLRHQIENSSVLSRRFTGAGFFTKISVSSECDAAHILASSMLDNVVCQINGVKNRAGFILYIEKGFLNCLEGYTFGIEPWPKSIEDFCCNAMQAREKA